MFSCVIFLYVRALKGQGDSIWHTPVPDLEWMGEKSEYDGSHFYLSNTWAGVLPHFWATCNARLKSLHKLRGKMVFDQWSMTTFETRGERQLHYQHIELLNNLRWPVVTDHLGNNYIISNQVESTYWNLKEFEVTTLATRGEVSKGPSAFWPRLQ